MQPDAMCDTLDDFREAITAAGLVPPESIIADGKIHRFSSNGEPYDDAGWYLLHDDGVPAGAFGCWRTGVNEKWSARSASTMTDRERGAHRRRLDTLRHQREAEERLQHAEAAREAQRIWEAATPAPVTHPYLCKKGVQPYDLRVDADGNLLIPVLIDGHLSSLQRIDATGDKCFLPGGEVKSGSFTLGDPTTARVVLIAEGYATAATLHEVTGSPVVVSFHSGNLKPVAVNLRTRDPQTTIFVCGDNDKNGRGQRAAHETADAVDGAAVIPATAGDDWNDVALREGTDAVRAAIESVLKGTRNNDPVKPTAGNANVKQAERLIDLAANAELFHAPDKTCCATMPVEDHQETWPLKSTTFKHWLRQKFYIETKLAPKAQALTDALATLESQALYDGDEASVHVRVAAHEGGIYLDLANETWQVVRITAAGWSLLDESPVKFRRPKGMLPLPTPVTGGQVADLKKFLNLDIEKPGDWHNLIVFLLASFRPTGPYPILMLHGEQGTAKSSNAKIIRDCLDPNLSPLRREPRDSRDLMISANNGWLIVLDNLSRINEELSDDLCRLATGGGFSTRTLYTDDEECLFDAMRPVIVTGIEDLATRPDLLERTLVLNLPPIDDTKRRDEASLRRDFELARPAILGALLTAVSSILKHLPSIHLDRLPRMADFAKWGTAAESGLGWENGTFLRSYQNNLATTHNLALDASVIVPPLLEVLAAVPKWTGTATDLKHALEAKITESVKAQRNWPRSAKGLSDRLRRIAPNLRATGIMVRWERSSDKSHTRLIEIKKVGNPSSELSEPSNPPYCQPHPSDESGASDASSDAPDASGTPFLDCISDSSDASDAHKHPLSGLKTPPSPYESEEMVADES